MQDNSGTLIANRVDIHHRQIRQCQVTWTQGRITEITDLGPENAGCAYLLPGFIDAHVHVESAMLPPAEFARLALCQGVIGAVCDPHEIANVLGIDGVRFMVDNSRHSPFLFRWGAPSCVPATDFETAGARLTAEDIATLLQEGGCHFLAEVMNVPGVLNNAPDLMAKLAAARNAGVPIDGHAPGLSGAELARYAAAGITTDHECSALSEALEKIDQGLHILIREGSAARNFSALAPLLRLHPEKVMFCSDDKHPDDLCRQHINGHVRRALAQGYDLFDTLRAASLNPVRHYALPAGLLRVGDRFDAQLVTSLNSLTLQTVWLEGRCVVDHGQCQLPHVESDTPNQWAAARLTVDPLQLKGEPGAAQVMVVEDASLVTRAAWLTVPCQGGTLLADPTQDVLLLAVVNRYHAAPPALALVQGFGFQRGAMASSVAHDSHNIVAVGSDPQQLATAINQVIEMRGGLAWADDSGCEALPLPIAGLMSPLEGSEVGTRYAALDAAVKHAGSTLQAPFMSLSFLALLVIPALKLSDRGLFDGTRFCFTTLQESVCTSC